LQQKEEARARMAQEKAAFQAERKAQIAAYKAERDAYIQRIRDQWPTLRKVKGASLPASPDSLQAEVFLLPAPGPDENPDIAIVDSLQKLGVTAEAAQDIARALIDSVGVDAFAGGEKLGVLQTPGQKQALVVSMEGAQASASAVHAQNTFTGVVQKAPPQKAKPARTRYQPPLATLFVTSKFGQRVDPLNPRKRQGHQGVDLRAAEGTPIHAAEGGKDTYACATASCKSKDGGIGIWVKHPDGFEARYYHLSQVQPRVGETVKRGQVIGLTGNSGTRTTGPHLHFELRNLQGEAVNPIGFIQ
jgi:murein DD-endopeptidase MepM/ murein hydrolase activator NlpD